MDQLVEAILVFANGTGLGWDMAHPKAWLRGPGQVLLLAMVPLFHLVELAGRWPRSWSLVLI